ncbi:hypothetical protein MAHJHV53_28540 [Mycobacterium avium subsp. hominissuis]|uniref:hypothetical protein n=1 Tax=Mycobacterium avium TaxID=1764 RepID=UPI00111BE74D|nr:hypothetical protein [Mycobacterium avium]
MTTAAGPISGIDPLDIPNLTEHGVFEYLANELAIPVTRNTIKWAVINREIEPTRIGKRNLFSRRDAQKWVTARQKR